jgi:hypothetical protein
MLSVACCLSHVVRCVLHAVRLFHVVSCTLSLLHVVRCMLSGPCCLLHVSWACGITLSHRTVACVRGRTRACVCACVPAAPVPTGGGAGGGRRGGAAAGGGREVPGVLRRCCRAAVQHCNIATVQQCNSATAQQCNSAMVQWCSIAALQRCNGATSQQCNSATVQQFNIATVQQSPPRTTAGSAQQQPTLQPRTRHAVLPPVGRRRQRQPRVRMGDRQLRRGGPTWFVCLFVCSAVRSVHRVCVCVQRSGGGSMPRSSRKPPQATSPRARARRLSPGDKCTDGSAHAALHTSCRPRCSGLHVMLHACRMLQPTGRGLALRRAQASAS